MTRPAKVALWIIASVMVISFLATACEPYVKEAIDGFVAGINGQPY